LSFYSAHWQLYYNAVKYTGYGAIGLTEAQLAIIGMVLSTAFLGQDFWGPWLQLIALVPGLIM